MGEKWTFKDTLIIIFVIAVVLAIISGAIYYKNRGMDCSLFVHRQTEDYINIEEGINLTFHIDIDNRMFSERYENVFFLYWIVDEGNQRAVDPVAIDIFTMEPGESFSGWFDADTRSLAPGEYSLKLELYYGPTYDRYMFDFTIFGQGV